MCPAPGTFLDRVDHLPEKPRPFRRFAARLIDILIAWIVVIGLLHLFDSRLLAEPSAFLWIMSTAVWVLLETLLLFSWRTTPGKWILGIRLETFDGRRPRVLPVLDRSFTVFSWGLGCMLPGLSVLCAVVGYQDLANAGVTRWDRGRFSISYAKLGFVRITVALAAILFLIICVALFDILPRITPAS